VMSWSFYLRDLVWLKNGIYVWVYGDLRGYIMVV
jgi:hypothetical protein